MGMGLAICRSIVVARWAPVGRKKRTARREVHLHVTGRIESRVMMADDCVVFVVDDDERIREALGELLASHDMRAITFGSAGDYERADKPDVPSCLRSEEHTSELQSLLRNSYAVFCLK